MLGVAIFIHLSTLHKLFLLVMIGTIYLALILSKYSSLMLKYDESIFGCRYEQQDKLFHPFTSFLLLVFSDFILFFSSSGNYLKYSTILVTLLFVIALFLHGYLVKYLTYVNLSLQILVLG